MSVYLLEVDLSCVAVNGPLHTAVNVVIGTNVKLSVDEPIITFLRGKNEQSATMVDGCHTHSTVTMH